MRSIDLVQLERNGNRRSQLKRRHCERNEVKRGNPKCISENSMIEPWIASPAIAASQ